MKWISTFNTFDAFSGTGWFPLTWSQIAELWGKLWIESFVLVFQAGQYIPHESVIEYSCETGVREVQCLLGRLSPGHPSCSSSDIVKGHAGLLIKVAFSVLFLYKFTLLRDQGPRFLLLLKIWKVLWLHLSASYRAVLFKWEFIIEMRDAVSQPSLDI